MSKRRGRAPCRPRPLRRSAIHPLTKPALGPPSSAFCAHSAAMADKENALENGMLATPVKASPGSGAAGAGAPTATPADLISFETPAPGRGAAAAGTLASAAATLTWDAATPGAATTGGGGGALAAELAALRAELVARDVRVDAAEAEVRRLEAAQASQAAELADALQQIADMEVAQASITARYVQGLVCVRGSLGWSALRVLRKGALRRGTRESGC